MRLQNSLASPGCTFDPGFLSLLLLLLLQGFSAFKLLSGSFLKTTFQAKWHKGHYCLPLCAQMFFPSTCFKTFFSHITFSFPFCATASEGKMLASCGRTSVVIFKCDWTAWMNGLLKRSAHSVLSPHGPIRHKILISHRWGQVPLLS